MAQRPVSPRPAGTIPEFESSRYVSPDRLSSPARATSTSPRPLSNTPSAPISPPARQGPHCKRPQVQVTRPHTRPSLLRCLLPEPPLSHSYEGADVDSLRAAEVASAEVMASSDQSVDLGTALPYITPASASASSTASGGQHTRLGIRPSCSTSESSCKTMETLLSRVGSLEAQVSQHVTVMDRLLFLESTARLHATEIERLRRENTDMKCDLLASVLRNVKARTKPVSLTRQASNMSSTPANLLTVVQLFGFEDQIAQCISPCTGNRRFAGKVGWNKLQKTCRSLHAACVSLEMDPSVRIVPDNFPTIRRAIQNIDKHDQRDHAKVVVRARPAPYTEQIVIDRRVALIADPSSSEKPVIHGRISIEEGAGGTVVAGFAVSNNNPRDPWGSAIDVNGTNGVQVENCELSSSANDETVLKLCNCDAAVRNNVISGGQTHGVTGISIHGKATATICSNIIVDNHVGVYLNPTATVRLTQNRIEKNHKGVQFNEEDIETIVEQGGFGRIHLRQNTFVDNRDGQSDKAFLKSLELLLHPLLRRNSRIASSTSASSVEDWEGPA